MIIRAFLTFPSEIMGRKRHYGGGDRTPGAETGKEGREGGRERRRMTKATNKHETANGIPIS